MIISLIGYRGTGKSTVGKLLGEYLGWEAVDADDEVERRAEKTIQAIFSEQGETAFRDLEAEVVSDLAVADEMVVSWGGGAILRDTNRRAITGAGPVIWLAADAATIASRLHEDPATAARRPNLTARGGLEEITAVLTERLPIYQRLADLKVDTQEKTPEEIAQYIADWLVRRGLL